MKPPFPKVHSCTVNHPLEVFYGLTMDCGKQMGQADVVWSAEINLNPTEVERHVTCPKCRHTIIGLSPDHEVYEYGLIDRGELRDWMEWREEA